MIHPYWFRLSDEERRNVVKCLRDTVGLGVSEIARAAGVAPATVAAWLSGKAAPQVDKIQALYDNLKDAVDRCLPEPPLSQIDVDRAIAIIAEAVRSKAWRDYVLDKLSVLFPAGIRKDVAFHVTREDLEVFKQRLAGEISNDQLGKYMRYLTRFLERVGWVLTPENLNKVKEVMETPKVAADTAKALKKFIKVVVKPKDIGLASALYASFTIPKASNKKTIGKLPSLEEVRRVWEEAAKISPCAAAVWGLLAETGVRLDHLLRVSIHGLDLEKRRLILGEAVGVKRQPLVFLTEGAVKYLRDVYLPWREEHLRKYHGYQDKLFPCKEHRIYEALKEARERAGLPWLEPSLLRKFHAQWLLDRGVDVTDIAVLQGRALPGGVGVTVEHYIYHYERRLREVFEKHAPRVFPP